MSSTIFQARNNLKPYQGLKPLVARTLAVYWTDQKPPKTLSGIETRVHLRQNEFPIHSGHKNLKPYQGLKQTFCLSFFWCWTPATKTLKPYQGLKLSFTSPSSGISDHKSPKTLSGIETIQRWFSSFAPFGHKNPKTLLRIETSVHRF